MFCCEDCQSDSLHNVYIEEMVKKYENNSDY